MYLCVYTIWYNIIITLCNISVYNKRFQTFLLQTFSHVSNIGCTMYCKYCHISQNTTIELSIQLKFTLTINTFIYTTVVTAFTYGTHVGWFCVPYIIVHTIFQCNISIVSNFIVTIINIISILPMPSEHECVHTCVY